MNNSKEDINMLCNLLQKQQTELIAKVGALKGVLDFKDKEIKRLNERFEHGVLIWRGIEQDYGDKPCKDCGGNGIKSYGSTSTWHGGIGGSAITQGVCDKCWGSGNIDKPWVNLKKIYKQLEEKDKEIERLDTSLEHEIVQSLIQRDELNKQLDIYTAKIQVIREVYDNHNNTIIKMDKQTSEEMWNAITKAVED